MTLVGSALGLVFSSLSSLDYVRHLDRQVHGIHCSFIPGAAAEDVIESGCRAAMNSPYSAVLRERIWGGVPISLFAVGAFSFFLALAVYLLIAGDKAPRRAARFLALTGATPLVVSIVMATISWRELGDFCQTCVGIYGSSLVLALGGLFAWLDDRKTARHALAPKPPSAGSNVPPTLIDEAPALPVRKMGSATLDAGWLLALGVFALAPAVLYLRSVPSYAARVAGCGTIESFEDSTKSLIHLTSARAQQPVLMLVDPLCPTCKAFHARLVSEGYFEKLDTTLVLFPLDSECNWNLSTPMHPGACLVSKAVVCAEGRELSVLEWAYHEQDAISQAAKSREGPDRVMALVEQRWPGTKACVENDKTRMRLDEMMRFAVKNKLPVATPQLFIGTQRLCDEDVDIGLSYALAKLAPALARR